MPLLSVNTRAKPLGTVRAPARDLDLANIRIRGARGVVADIKRSTESAELLQTIEGASTLTFKIRDYSRNLLRSSVPQVASTVVLDNVEYTLVKVSHDENEITLVFEETAVNLLRQDRYSKPKKANRSNTTRAQFIRGMVAEVRERAISFNCPEEGERQKILPPAEKPTSS